MTCVTFRSAAFWNSAPMDTIEQYVRSVESRIIGRVFTFEDRLHFVLDADRESGLARLSCRYDQRTEFIYMPVAEVLLRLEEECRRHAVGVQAVG